MQSFCTPIKLSVLSGSLNFGLMRMLMVLCVYIRAFVLVRGDWGSTTIIHSFMNKLQYISKIPSGPCKNIIKLILEDSF